MNLPSLSLRAGTEVPCRASSRRGFTLIELLVVVAIMAMLAALSAPAVRALKASGGVNNAVVAVSTTMEYGRNYAMGNHTYVRIAIGQAAAATAGGTPSTVLVAIYSVDGTLDADSSTGMVDASKWRLLAKPVILSNFTVSKTLSVDMSLDASSYVSPDQTDIPGPVSFRAGDLGAVACRSFIQFNPDGAPRVLRSEPARFIDLALDTPAPLAGRNPFVIRLSGMTGNVSILRKGEGIQ